MVHSSLSWCCAIDCRADLHVQHVQTIVADLCIRHVHEAVYLPCCVSLFPEAVLGAA